MKLQRAEQTALEYLRNKYPSFELELVIEPERAIEKPYGWILFFNSKKYLEGNHLGTLYGNGPLVVLTDGRVIQLGTSGPIGERIAEFESKLKGRSFFYRVLMYVGSMRKRGKS